MQENKPEKKSPPEEKVQQPILVLDRMVFLPHYILPDRWCGPGTNKHNHEVTFSTDEMMRLGARKSYAYLWRRSWTG